MLGCSRQFLGSSLLDETVGRRSTPLVLCPASRAQGSPGFPGQPPLHS